MANVSLENLTIAATYDLLLIRNNSWSSTGNEINLMNDSGVIQPSGFYIDPTNDRIGIGEAAPDTLLHIKSATPWIDIEDSGASNERGKIGMSDNNMYIAVTSNSGNIYFRDNMSTTVDPGGAGTTNMAITSTGNIGIGTESPDRALHVWAGNAGAVTTNASSNMVIEDSGDNFLELASPDVNDVGILFADPGGAPGSIIYDHQTDNLTIDADDDIIFTCEKVGIGAPSPNAGLHVKHTAASWFVAYLDNEGNNASAYGLGIQCGTNGASAGAAADAQPLIFYDGSGDGLGKVEAGTTSAPAFAAPSDRKLKKDIIDTKVDGLGVVNGLKMRQFGWKKYPDAVTKIGFIAQECQDVYPEMVTTGIPSADGTDDGLDTLAVSDSVLVPVLVKAVQELSAKVTALEGEDSSSDTKIAALEAKDTASEAKIAALEAKDVEYATTIAALTARITALESA